MVIVHRSSLELESMLESSKLQSVRIRFWREKRYKDMAGKDSKDMAGKNTKDMAGKDTNEMAGKDTKIWREKTPKYGGNHFQIYPHHPPIDHTIQHQRSTQHCRCRRPPNKYHPTIFHLEVVVLIAHSLLLPISSARFIDPGVG